ncbi:aquaporin FA-CHIP-like [Ruditapes philippinarum]|uniref:aquaporin FA-CHIP-like n=1 Tax=Ruditapes philippinarum TaxID=129788 RepID=UPI00295ACC2C|nr:aquaporin FA-CHIP-like [Ruditapes philippinarum]
MEGYFLHIASKLEELRVRPGTGKFNLLTELKSWDLWRGVIAELIATALFVLIGSMSAMDINQTDEGDKNAKFIRCKTGTKTEFDVIEFVGVTSRSLANHAIEKLQCKCSREFTPSRLHNNLAVTTINPELNVGQGLGCEIIFTFILVMSIMGCTDMNRPLFGSPAIGIGFTVAVVHLAAIPFTAASMNPARSLGSAVISKNFTDLWVYWVGPIAGGIVAAVVYKFVFNPYRKHVSYKWAAKELMNDTEMIVIPRDYFSAGQKTDKSNGNVLANNVVSCSHDL